MHVPFWMMRYINTNIVIFIIKIMMIINIFKIIITIVKVWILGGFNEDYDWQAGEEGFLSSTEVIPDLIILLTTITRYSLSPHKPGGEDQNCLLESIGARSSTTLSPSVLSVPPSACKGSHNKNIWALGHFLYWGFPKVLSPGCGCRQYVAPCWWHQVKKFHKKRRKYCCFFRSAGRVLRLVEEVGKLYLLLLGGWVSKKVQ